MESSILLEEASRLLEAALRAAEQPSSLAERRQLVLEELGRLVNATAGHWAWGRGHPARSTVAPVAIIDFGFTPKELAVHIQGALDPELDSVFRSRILGLMGDNNHSTVTRQSIYTDDEWYASRWFRHYLSRIDFDAWLHTVHYRSADTWSNMILFRRVGEPLFDNQDAAIVDLAMVGIPWLQATAEERLPAESFVGLSSRQRTVMLLLLDGLSRKQIAARLGIGEETVNHHVKAIYQHFDVQSATELAALFLKSR